MNYKYVKYALIVEYPNALGNIIRIAKLALKDVAYSEQLSEAKNTTNANTYLEKFPKAILNV